MFENKTVRLADLQKAVVETKKERSKKTSENGLFEKLRQLRSRIAIEENVPAYIIFSDASLKDMEVQMPSTKAEFSTILGVGKVKQDKYATRFLEVITAQNVKPKTKIPTHEQSYLLYKQGKSISDISKERRLKEGTIYSHLMKMSEQGEVIDFEQIITSEDIERIQKAKEELGEIEGLKQLFIHFEEQIPYWKLRLGMYLSN